VLYFMAAFILYAAVDLLAWRWSYNLAHAQLLSEMEAAALQRLQASPVGDRDRSAGANRFAYRGVVGPLAVLRAVFDFGVPVVAGAIAVGALLRTPV
jgi:hypothetical protein